MVLKGVEADLVAVGVVQLGQDPADAGPVHPGVLLAQRGQPARELVDRFLVGHADGEVVESRGRVVDVAIVGDTEPLDMLGREGMQTALTAPTAAERIAAGAAVGRQIMKRTGALFAVAQQAAALEPQIAGFWQQGREQARRAHALFWTRMADDGLLNPAVDLTWLIETTSLLAAGETYLLITRTVGWDLDTYQDWLTTTWARLSTAARQHPRAPGDTGRDHH